MLSKYTLSLDAEAQKRYKHKISSVNGIDPYTLNKLSSSNLPTIEATDLVNYLVLGMSAYIAQQFKAYRSLEAYNQCLNGWIKEVAGTQLNDKFVVIGKVNHFMTII